MGAAEGITKHSLVCIMFSPSQSLAMFCLKDSLFKVQSARDADGLRNFIRSLSRLIGFCSFATTLSYFSIAA